MIIQGEKMTIELPGIDVKSGLDLCDGDKHNWGDKIMQQTVF